MRGEGKIAKRAKKLQDMQNAATSAEDALRSAAEALAESRRRRDDTLRIMSRQLQGVDRERQGLCADIMKALTTRLQDALEPALAVTKRAHEAASAIDNLFDERIFLHERRVAAMLDELEARRFAASAHSGNSNNNTNSNSIGNNSSHDADRDGSSVSLSSSSSFSP